MYLILRMRRKNGIYGISDGDNGLPVTFEELSTKNKRK
jgi:hypothetical protein